MVETDDVRSAFAHLSDVEIENSRAANGVRVAVPNADDTAGEFWRIIRTNGFDAQAKRLGNTLVAHIEAEESKSLADLFG